MGEEIRVDFNTGSGGGQGRAVPPGDLAGLRRRGYRAALPGVTSTTGNSVPSFIQTVREVLSTR